MGSTAHHTQGAHDILIQGLQRPILLAAIGQCAGHKDAAALVDRHGRHAIFVAQRKQNLSIEDNRIDMVHIPRHKLLQHVV